MKNLAEIVGSLPNIIHLDLSDLTIEDKVTIIWNSNKIN